MIILADDLTGANDTAIQFVKAGLRALVIPRAPEDLSSGNDYDVIALNSNSRGMKAADAYRTVRNMAVSLGTLRGDYVIYKKMDSVLRGNPAEELEAVMDELNIPLAIVAPSFPANRSTLEQGMLSSGAGEANAVELFARGMKRRVEGIPLEELRKGPGEAADYAAGRQGRGVRVFIADAVTDGDLETVYRLSLSLGSPLIFAGAAGLANQIARHIAGASEEDRPSVPAEPFNPGGPLLVVAGTRQGETAAQIEALSAAAAVPVIRFSVDLAGAGMGGDAILRAYGEAETLMAASPGLCIVAVESMFKAGIPEGDVARDTEDGSAISAALGILAEKLLGRFRFPVLITTGGDTSLSVCGKLGVRGIEPAAELCPGIPLGRIAGGAYEGRYIVTKSGRFGRRDSLMEIWNYLSKPAGAPVGGR